MLDDLLPEALIAETRRCSVRTLQRERVSGRGCPYVKIGGRIYYREADWTDFVQKCRRLSTSEPASD
jgi:hypothetical protein